MLDPKPAIPLPATLRARAGIGWRALGSAVDLLLPPVCPGCRAAVNDAESLCASCWSSLRFITEPLCPVYGTPFAADYGEGTLSPEAMADPPPFRSARSAVHYGDTARQLVHRLKYQDRHDMAHVVAKFMRQAGRHMLEDCDILVPVPLGRWRLWQRRCNQAAILGDRLSLLTGRPHDPFALRRVRATRSQVGLTARQRALNVRAAFRVPESAKARIQGRAVVLLDDVYTSGATAKAATGALLAGGARQVDVLTFARVLSQ
jgi:ComF family protein